MRHIILTAALATTAFAGTPVEPQRAGNPNPEPFLDTEASFNFRADYEGGGSGTGWQALLRTGVLYEIPHFALPWRDRGMWHLRLGLEHQRFEFDHSGGLPLPERLQSVSAILGLELHVDGRIGAIIEARPGVFFENDPDSGAWDCPVKLGLGIPLSDTFALALMARYNGFARHPFLGGVGFVWDITPSLTLAAIAPEPRLTWRAAGDLSLWLGGEWAGGGYRTERFGGAVVDYTDYRIGAGLTWTPGVWSIELGGGMSIEREWDYHRADRRIKTDEPAPYVKMAIRAAW